MTFDFLTELEKKNRGRPSWFLKIIKCFFSSIIVIHEYLYCVIRTINYFIETNHSDFQQNWKKIYFKIPGGFFVDFFSFVNLLILILFHFISITFK